MSAVSITCPNCHREIDTSRTPLSVWCEHDDCSLSIGLGRWAVSILVVASIAAAILFRIGDSIWPLYLVLAFGVLSLYAVLFSRGGTLGSTAVLYVLIVAAWGAWEGADWLSRASLTRDLEVSRTAARLLDDLRPRLPYLSLLCWGVGALWVIVMARGAAVSSVRLTATYVLFVGAFVLGLWGSVAILIESAAVDGDALRVTLLAAIIVPVIFLVLLLRAQSPEQQGAFLLSIVVMVLLSYLATIQFLVEVIDRGLGGFLPHLLGQPSLPPIELGWLEDVLRWRGIASAILTAGIFLLLVGKSAGDALRKSFGPGAPEWYRQQRARLKAHRGPEKYFAPILMVNLSIALMTYRLAMFVRWTVVLLVRNTVEAVWESLRYVLFIAVPILAFSAISVVFIVVLQAFSEYHLLGIGTPRVLWGEVLTTLALTVVLATVALAFSPGGWPLIGAAIEGMAWFGVIGYAVISLAALSLPLLYYPLDSLGVTVPAFRPGELLVINIVSLLIFAGLIGIAMLLPSNSRLSMPLFLALAAVFVSVAMVFGADPIRASIWEASRAGEAGEAGEARGDGGNGPARAAPRATARPPAEPSPTPRPSATTEPTPRVRLLSPAARTPTAEAADRPRGRATEAAD